MPNIKLILEYNGSGFHGWQVQPELRTVQGEVHRALELCTGESIRNVQSAGRTDAGVHARGQVVNFHLSDTPDLEKISRSVSSILKNEVAVLSAEIVPDEFNAMRDAVRKQYSYYIYSRPYPPVLNYGQVWHIAAELDTARMKREAESIIGKHDFTSFRGSGCGSRSPIKTIYESEIRVEPPFVIYRVIGSGFLKQMVRNLIGALVAIGKGRYGETTMLEILEWRDRTKAPETAQPYGLFLDWVEY